MVAPEAASAYEAAPAAPVARTTFAAPAGSLEPKTTLWREESPLANPRPIFPVPMTAIFTTPTLDPRGSRDQVLLLLVMLDGVDPADGSFVRVQPGVDSRSALSQEVPALI
jgi:hypothetical protein